MAIAVRVLYALVVLGVISLVLRAAFGVVSILLARPESRPYFQRRPAVVTSGSQPG